MNVGVLIFHEVSEFEVAGIMGVFGSARTFLPVPEALEGAAQVAAEPQPNPLEVFTLSKTRASIRGAGGLIMTPTYAFAGAPEPDILVVPGGLGAEKISKDVQTKEYLRAQAARVKFLVSISSGAMLLGEANLLTDLDVTTTPALAETIWKYNPGNVIGASASKNPNGLWFAASALAGIELALEIVTLEFGAEIAGKTSTNLGFS
jgi:transcriptional regulator GlxA family with amidase domain